MSSRSAKLPRANQDRAYRAPLAAGRSRSPTGKTVGRLAVRRVLAELRQRLEELYGARLVRLVLYGSQARGDARSSSDIDVLVVLRKPVDPATEIARVGPITATLSLNAGVVLSCQFVSEKRFASEQSPLLMNVRREGVAV